MSWLLPAAMGLNAVLGIGSQVDTNKKNLQIARETNEMQKELFHENLDFQREMYQKEMDYQDPSNLRKLLENAGYNPAALVAGAQSMLGSAPSAGSGSSIPSLTAAHMENPLTPQIASAVQNMASMAGAQNQLEDAKGKGIENMFKAEQMRAEINRLKAAKVLSEAQADEIDQKITLVESTWNDLLNLAHQQTRKAEAEANKAYADADYTQALKDTKLPKEVEEIEEKIRTLISERGLNVAEAYAKRMGVEQRWFEAYTQRIMAQNQGEYLGELTNLTHEQFNAKALENILTTLRTNIQKKLLENPYYQTFLNGKQVLSDVLGSVDEVIGTVQKAKNLSNPLEFLNQDSQDSWTESVTNYNKRGEVTGGRTVERKHNYSNRGSKGRKR